MISSLQLSTVLLCTNSACKAQVPNQTIIASSTIQLELADNIWGEGI